MATTMTEAFDAPMTDSGDVDVSMYQSTATTDSWLEASMGDDAFTGHPMTLEHVQEGVEVEMGDDDEELITEYEMADEGDGYGVQEELPDIEVYDISQIPSPLQIEGHDLSIDTHGSAENVHFLPSDGAVQDLSHSHPTSVSVVETSATVSVDEAFHPAKYPADLSVADTDSLVPHPDALFASAGEAPHLELEYDPTHRSTPDEGPVELDSSHEPHLNGSELRMVESTIQPHTESPPPSVEHAEPGEGYAEEHAVFEHADLKPSVAATNDPHEISEGVYIDPPPPVLLSLPPSAEYVECSLFNISASSMPQSPSSSAKPDTGASLHLILQDRPTLYYEPLSAVFTALRQEECIQNMPGFSEAELLLDAYDLQLSISEDNVYTHEVTLHELNVIHDGSDLSGPLRLCLKVFSPRFVTRYTMLRDQIARLNLTGDGDAEAGAEPASADRPGKSGYEAWHETDTVAQGTSLTDAEQQNEAGFEAAEALQNDTSVLRSTDVDSIQEEQAEVDAFAEAGEEDAAEDDEENDVGNDGAAIASDAGPRAPGADQVLEEVQGEKSADRLDADEVHEHAVEEAGDYVDYAAFPDDEDNFGEDSPEELGGEANNSAYPPLDDAAAGVDNSQSSAENEEYGLGELVEADGEENEERQESVGLHPDADTNNDEDSDSIEAQGILENGHSAISATDEQAKAPVEAHGSSQQQESVVSGGYDADEGLDDNDNWDDAVEETPLYPQDTLSRKSSTTTLESRTSKRAYEEVELDDFEDDDFGSATSPSSPDTKRLRVQ